MPVPVPSVTSERVVEYRRVRYRDKARHMEDNVYEAVSALVRSGAIPEDRWRFLAHVLYCRAIYATHIAPLEAHLTFAEIANHLAEIGVPRFRGSSDWSASAITDIRQVVGSPHNQIMLPDP